MAHASVAVPVHVIAAGKLRRYHGISLWRQLLDIPTVAKNIRDIFYITAGFVQSLLIVQRFKPDVVFVKGGYVSLPLGYAAKLLGVPIVIHDSDARPGLTNSLLSRFAAAIATGSPLENYTYPSDRTTYTGVPIAADHHPFTAREIIAARHDIGIVDLNKPLIVVTGGGLGAGSINNGILAIAKRLVEDGYAIYHVTGKNHYGEIKQRAIEHVDYHIVEFVYKDMSKVLGAADIVVSRGSATFLQELAALAKPTIIVPAHHLSDQIKNAAAYKAADAAIVLDDKTVADGESLYDAITRLHQNETAAAEMANRLHEFYRPDAAADVAELIARHGSKHRKER